MRRTFAMLLGLCVTLPPALVAQIEDLAQLRVRITSARYGLDRQIGSVVFATADSLKVEVERLRTEHFRQRLVRDTLALSLDELDRLEVSRKSGRRTGRGALIGVGVGSVAGLALGLATWKECHPEPNGFFTGLDCMYHPGSAIEQGFMGAAVLGIVGAGIGAIAGSMTHGDKWEEVPRALMLMQRLPEGRLGVGLAISF